MTVASTCGGIVALGGAIGRQRCRSGRQSLRARLLQALLILGLVGGAMPGQASTVLRVVPPLATIEVGDVFELRIEIESDLELDGAAAFVTLDPTVLEIIDVVSGEALPVLLQSGFDARAGTIDFVAGTLWKRPVGLLNLATARLRARTATAATSVMFATEPPRESDVTLGGSSLRPVLQAANLSVALGPSSVSIEVVAPPDAIRLGSEIDLQVRVNTGAKLIDAAAAYLDFDPAILAVTGVLPGSALATVLESSIDNEGGKMGFAAGTLTAAASGSFLLATVRVRALSEGSTQVALHENPPRRSEVTYAGTALQTGLRGSSIAVRFSNTAVSLRLEPSASSVPSGGVIEVSIAIDAGSEVVDGAAAFLDFDPHQLQVVSVSPGASLPAEIFRLVDNAIGRVDYAAGTLANLPAGRFTLAVVAFRAIATASVSSSILVHHEPPRATDVTFAGRSLLSTRFDTEVMIISDGNEVALELSVGDTPILAGSEFDLVTSIRAGASQIDGAAVYLDFDPTQLQVVGVTPTMALPVLLQSRFDNVAGQVDFAVGVLVTVPPAGSFDVLTLKMRALRAGVTRIVFHQELPRMSQLTLSGATVATRMPHRDLTIGAADARLAVIAPATTLPAGAVFDVILEVESGASPVDGAAASLIFDPRYLQVESVVPGTGLPQVLVSRFDNKKGTAEVAAGAFQQFPSGRFALATFRMRATAPTGITSTAVTLGGQHGWSDVTFAGRSLAPQLVDGTLRIGTSAATVRLVASSYALVLGEVFSLEVGLSPAGIGIDGIAAILQFDPSVFEVVRIDPGPAFEQVLLSRYDNGLGQIEFAAGTLGSQVDMGYTVAARILLGTIQTTEETRILFQQGSDATSLGGSVYPTFYPPIQGICSGDICFDGDVFTVGLDPIATATATRPIEPTRSETPTPMPTPTPVATGSPSPTLTASLPSRTPTASPSRTPTPMPITPQSTPIVGDCDRSREVTIDELVLGVRIVLGEASLSTCPAFDADRDGEVSIHEVIRAVNCALMGCSSTIEI